MRDGVPTKPMLDEVGAETDGLEELRAVVAGEQRDAHLGEDLEQPLLGGDAVVAKRLLEVGGSGARGRPARGGAGPAGAAARASPVAAAGGPS